MPVAYPPSLRGCISASKSRSQPASFRIFQPRRGFGYAQATGLDTPIFYDVTLRFTTAEAVVFQDWFANTTLRGQLSFAMPIRTEYGLIDLECRFLDEGLLNAREIGEVWEYTATIMTRTNFLDGRGAPVYDPYFSQVILLLHGDGPNAGTTFTDSSSFNRSLSIVAGVPTTSTTHSKFGGSSIYGAAGASQIGFSTGAEGVAEEWTVELFLRRDASNLHHAYLSTETGSGYIFQLKTPANLGNYELMIANSGLLLLSGVTPLTVGPWYHVAFTRRFVVGTTYRVSIWLDGVEDAFTTAASTDLDFDTGSNSIGRADVAGFAGFQDYIDEMRVTMGVARYTATFTPPTAPFPNA